MPYTNPTQEAAYTLPSGSSLVNSTIALSNTTTVGEVYCQQLTIADGAFVSSSVVGDGGKIINSGTSIKNIDVKSGGSVNMLVAGKSAVNITAASGATLENCLANATRLDGTWNITRGARFVHGTVVFDDIYTDDRGYLMNYRVRGAVHIQNGMKIGNADINSYLYVNAGGEVSGGTVQKGAADYLRLNAGAYAQDIKVLSGGSVKFYGTFATLRDVIADDGARITLAANNYLAGEKTTFVKGALTNTNGANVYAADGVIYNWQRLDFAAFYFSDITLSNANATGQFLYLMDGAVARDTTIGAGNQTGIVLGKNADGLGSAINTSATSAGGYITVWNYQNECTFGGVSNDVAAGHIIIGAAGAGKANSSLSMTGGTINGLQLKYNTTSDFLVKVKLIEGLNANSAVVSSGGTLTLTDGGSATDLTLNANGAVQVRNGGSASRAIVSGGKLTVADGGHVDTLTVDGHAANNGVIVNGRVDNLIASDANLVVGAVSVGRGGMLSGAVLSGTLGRNIITLTDEGRINDADVQNGNIYINASGTLSNLRQSGGQVIARGSGAIVDGADVLKAGNVTNGGELYVQNGGSAFNITVSSGGSLMVEMKPTYAHGTDKNPLAQNVDVQSGGFAAAREGATLAGLRVSNGGIASASSGTIIDAAIAGTVNLMSSGAAMIDADILYGGIVRVFSGAVLSGAVAQRGAAITVDGGKLVDATVAGRLNFYENKPFAILTGSCTNIAEGTLFYEGQTAVSGSAEFGILSGLNANGSAFKLSVGDGIVVKDAKLDNSDIRISAFDGASVDGTQVNAGAIICNSQAFGTMTNVTLSGGQMNLSGTAKAKRTIIENGGKLYVNASTASFDDTILKVGGQIIFSAGVTGVDTGKSLTLDFVKTAGTMNVDLSKLANSTTIYATGVETVGTYTLGTGSRNGITQKWGLYENTLVNGGTWDDALNEVTYSFNGTALTTAALEIRTGAAAGLSGDNYTALRTNDRAAKWTSAADNATLVTENFSGDAYLTVAGDAAKAIYGAGVDFAGTVNLDAKSGTIRNLAAGAEAGKTVGAVKLTFDGATLAGAGYAGGFGSVTGETETLITTGSFTKDFYAGALANKLDSVTSVGDVSMTIDGGTFSGNIFGASAVKTVAGKNGTRHTAGDVTLTVTGGSTTKGTQACIFAGGYATGDATGTVYTVDSVTATISGGSWGEAAGGRGVFGGIFASGVTAKAGNVNLTVSGDATMGNVYGGGWAQKNGSSIVGDVNLTISGGTIANVFGGGSHSTSGGTTETGDITITVSGGDITGAIYARGQLEGDTTGAASVIFTGATDFACDVYGYSYVGSETGDAALSFSGYTGEFAGALGGFNGITLDGSTAMTLSTESGSVSNGKWVFDLTDRADVLAGASLLTWDDADFAGDSIKVSFADDTQAQGGWNIAAVAEAFNDTSFDVEIGGSEIVSGLAYKGQIGSGDYQGWGFELESGVLKFKNLA